MCELGFGWPSLDAISLYNAGLPWFAAGALGVGVPAKALAMWRIWAEDTRRLLLASFAAITVFALLLVWYPSGAVVWVLITKLIGSCEEWCIWLLLVSAGVATGLDVALMRFAFRRQIPMRSKRMLWLFAANLLSIAAGYAAAIWHDLHHPPVA